MAALVTAIAAVACIVVVMSGAEHQEASTVLESEMSFVQVGGPSVADAEHEVQVARAVEAEAENSVNAAQVKAVARKQEHVRASKMLNTKLKKAKAKMKSQLKKKMKA